MRRAVKDPSRCFTYIVVLITRWAQLTYPAFDAACSDLMWASQHCGLLIGWLHVDAPELQARLPVKWVWRWSAQAGHRTATELLLVLNSMIPHTRQNKHIVSTCQRVSESAPKKTCAHSWSFTLVASGNWSQPHVCSNHNGPCRDTFRTRYRCLTAPFSGKPQSTELLHANLELTQSLLALL